MGTTVVIATHGRRRSLLHTLARLAELPEELPVVVVDNASTDGTAAAVAREFPSVRVLRLARNAGAAARTDGVRAAGTPYVAFCDDDSWWAPDALARAEQILDADESIALVAARVLVGPEEDEDPACAAMAASPLGDDVLGFIACGAVVRRDAYLAVGGFHEGLQLGGEETLLALDLARTGRRLVYADDVVAHHYPAPERNRDRRRMRVARNAVLVAWLRLSAAEALRRTARLARSAAGDPAARRALSSLLARAPVVVRDRRAVPPALERDLLRVEAAAAGTIARATSERRDAARV